MCLHMHEKNYVMNGLSEKNGPNDVTLDTASNSEQWNWHNVLKCMLLGAHFINMD